VPAEGPRGDERAAEGLPDVGARAVRTAWRGIGALDEAVGGYCWLERRVFEVTGHWATATGNAIGHATGNAIGHATGNAIGHATGNDASAAEIRVFFAAVSRRHGSLAERWGTRLPVRAGVDPSALVGQPPGLPEEVAAHLAETADSERTHVETETETEQSGAGRLRALVGVVLPWLAGEYEAHLALASPASEAPVIEVLVEARRAAVAEAEGGRRLLVRLGEIGPSGTAAPRR
jgi:hypothetical protein